MSITVSALKYFSSDSDDTIILTCMDWVCSEKRLSTTLRKYILSMSWHPSSETKKTIQSFQFSIVSDYAVHWRLCVLSNWGYWIWSCYAVNLWSHGIRNVLLFCKKVNSLKVYNICLSGAKHSTKNEFHMCHILRYQLQVQAVLWLIQKWFLWFYRFSDFLKSLPRQPS